MFYAYSHAFTLEWFTMDRIDSLTLLAQPERIMDKLKIFLKKKNVVFFRAKELSRGEGERSSNTTKYKMCLYRLRRKPLYIQQYKWAASEFIFAFYRFNYFRFVDGDYRKSKSKTKNDRKKKYNKKLQI